MIELRNHELHVSFPEVHPNAVMSLHFQRTLRIPDGGKLYSLPAGLGRSPSATSTTMSTRFRRRGSVTVA
jgi:hypothetical protein